MICIMIRSVFWKKIRMLEWGWQGITLQLSLLFPFSIVVLLSLDTSRVTELCLFASLLHEIGHALAMCLLHDRPSKITMGFFGMRVQREKTQRISYVGSALVSLAGPFMNVVFVAIFSLLHNPVAASVHAIIGGFNLLPVYSLDGGEALYALLCLRYEEEKTAKILRLVSCLVAFPLLITGFCLFVSSRYNFSLLAVSSYLILLIFLRHKH